MKSLYPGHFKPSESDIQAMWEKALFVFDTNVFLHLYQYSYKTQEQLLAIIKELENRIWIPNKVADEFIGNRLKVLEGQIDKYDAMKDQLTDVLEKLGNPREHPFIDPDIFLQMREAIEKIQTQLEKGKEELMQRLNNDEILQKLGDLTEGRVGKKFSNEELSTIYLDGENRAKNNIPPGYLDVKEKSKSDPGNNYRIYGDLIIWKEILAKAKTDKVGVIFISDEKKTDWWLYSKKRKISPLPALFQEFFSESGQSFYMLTADRFVADASKFLEKKVSPEIIQEVKDVREYLYKIIHEQELIDILRDYEQFIAPSYVGLKIFVTSILARKGYEINHSYALINNLVERGVIKMAEKQTEYGGTAQSISLY